MSTPTIDYDALAAQHGGTAAVDYDALAAQHGGTAASTTPPPQQSWYDRNLKGTLSGTAGWQQAIDQAAQTEPVTGAGSVLNNLGAGATRLIASPLAHPVQTAAGLGRMTLAGLGDTQAQVDVGRQMAEPFVRNPSGEIVAALPQAALAVAPDAATLAQRGIGRALLLGKTPEAAYESALKPSTTIPQAQRASIVQTGLENNIPVSKAGLQNIGNLIDRYNAQIKATIDAAPSRQISTVPALQNLNDVRAKFANQVTPQPDMAEINQVQSNFLNNPKMQPQGAGPGPGSLSASDAQAMKQGTYQALGSKAYGEVKGASIEAQKALARGLKEEIANQFPEISNLNAQESRLLDLEPILERAVNRTANHQIIGIGTPIAGAATKAITGSGGAGAVAGVLKAVLDNPMVKSRLAISLSKGANIPIGQASARVAAYSSALGSVAASAPQSSADQTASQ